MHIIHCNPLDFKLCLFPFLKNSWDHTSKDFICKHILVRPTIGTAISYKVDIESLNSMTLSYNILY
jgi:hypothetical protein